MQIKTKKQASKIKGKGELLYGIQPVHVALQQRKRKFERLYLKRNADSSTRLKEIRILAEKDQIPVSEFAVTQLTKMCPNAVHQGVVLRCSFLPISSISDLPQSTEGRYPIIVVLDQIEDPHNLGAILRTCGFYDVSAVVVPRNHSSSLTPVVSKASAGVAEWFPVISVTNLAVFIQEQKNKGFWVVGLDGESPESLANLSCDRPLIIVMGNEGRGIRHLIRKHCDWMVHIPGNPKASSLNVSNATAVTLYHLHAQPQTS